MSGERFALVGGRSEKLCCTVCGARGWPDPEGRGWQATHAREHHPCPTCGKLLVALSSGAPRRHHKGCSP